jgi:hypothetical protein
MSQLLPSARSHVSGRDRGFVLDQIRGTYLLVAGFCGRMAWGIVMATTNKQIRNSPLAKPEIGNLGAQVVQLRGFQAQAMRC